MNDVEHALRVRMKDIVIHLNAIRFVERCANPSIVGHGHARKFRISSTTIDVMKAGVFVHLYNLVESTISGCFNEVCRVIQSNEVSYSMASERWQHAWILAQTKSEQYMTVENRVLAVKAVCEHILRDATVEVAVRSTTGNFDDRQIENMTERYGIALALSATTRTSVKRTVLNDMGFLGLIRTRRNDLAHGLVSFADVGRDYTANDLTRWAWGTFRYLREVVASFRRYVDNNEYIDVGRLRLDFAVLGLR